MPDVLVTGLPRSGSTLVSALIDGLPNAVCLNTPPWQQGLLSQNPLEVLPYCKWLTGDFLYTRRQLIEQHPVIDIRAADGMPLTDGMFDPRTKRNDKDQHDTVAFARPGLSEDFILAMRDTTIYTALLPTLLKFKHFKIIAVIRHPFDVLTSWRQFRQPMIERGRPHGIARFWPEALAITESGMEMADQMVQLYDAYIQRYHELREHIHIVKFEDVVESPVLVSKLFGLETPSPNVSLIEKRTRMLMTAEISVFRERLRKFGVFTRQFYPDI